MAPVIVRSAGGFRTEIDTGTHRFISDEPPSVGGTDEGPTPYDLISAALGACTSMTLHFLARRDQMPLEGVEVEIVHDRKHAKDCVDCITTSGYIHHFNVTIRILGDRLTPEQRARLADVAKRCPVYKTLTSEIRINEVVVS